ncbi:hypothetical protein [Agromyces mariniharenae]|uniref:Uncharacterized protein n=1 Tax=Agromyces mariniharenae TaxID=2604423 RepID=A0A5S4V1N5_9MICO|nr:hypothetical protein [Agromyces mariniharenae]TYL50430.1 hypothetical protein FYC51_14580 [Agromyces mariniharenae]
MAKDITDRGWLTRATSTERDDLARDAPEPAEAPDSGVPVPSHRSGVVPTHGDGYEFIAVNEGAGWRAVPDWAAEGWDLGRWPTTVVMFSDDYEKPRALLYIEGDTEEWEFDSVEQRERYVDTVAEELWRTGEADGPRDIGAYPAGRLPVAYRRPAPTQQSTPPASGSRHSAGSATPMPSGTAPGLAIARLRR